MTFSTTFTVVKLLRASKYSYTLSSEFKLFNALIKIRIIVVLVFRILLVFWVPCLFDFSENWNCKLQMQLRTKVALTQGNHMQKRYFSHITTYVGFIIIKAVLS